MGSGAHGHQRWREGCHRSRVDISDGGRMWGRQARLSRTDKNPWSNCTANKGDGCCWTIVIESTTILVIGCIAGWCVMEKAIREFSGFAKKLLTEIRGIADTLFRVQKQIETIAEQNKVQNECEQPPPVVRAELQIPPAVQTQNEAREVRTEWRDKLKIKIEIATFLAVFAYAIINYHMLCEMRKANKDARDYFSHTLGEMRAQTTLTRQQVVSAQQAIVEVNINFAGDGLQVMPYNQGQVTAKDIHATIEVTRKTFPGLGLIKKDSFILDLPILPPGQVPQIGPNSPQRHYELANLTENDRLSLKEAKQITFIDLRLQYENGFGDTIPQHSCKFVLLHNNGTGGVDIESHPCDEILFWSRYHRNEQKTKYH